MALIHDKLYSLLRWSEQYTKTDMVYLTRGGFWLSIGQFVSTTSSFVLAIAFANLLPAETYGTYRYVISFAGLFAIPALTGIGSALTQAVARGYEGSFVPGLMMRLQWGTLGTLGSLGLAAYYLFFNNLELALAFALAAPFVPLVEISSMYGALLAGRKMFAETAWYFLITRAVFVGILLAALAITDNLYVVLAAYFIPQTLAQTIIMLRVLRRNPVNTATEPETLRYGVHLSFNEVINQVGLYLDNILLFHYLGPLGVAIYTFASAPIKQIRGAYKNVPLLALPKLSVRTVESIDDRLWLRLGQLFGIGVLISLSYIAVAPFVFRILFSEYMESVPYTQLLAVLLAFELPLTFLGAAVQSRLHVTPRSWLYLRNVPAGTFILSALILTPLYGILGVIVGRFISTAASFAILWGQWIMLVRREKDVR
ncbi:MAG TPA: oligosaccharide flippase family protein [Candidatus Paceibacterota bacterium]|nr:oligosaccharide flippase family protein [Candidatus Paceibacterota bacterium]